MGGMINPWSFPFTPRHTRRMYEQRHQDVGRAPGESEA